MAQPDETGINQQYEVLQARFDQAAKLYDAQYGPPSGSRPGNPLLSWLREEHLSVVRGLVGTDAALLDIGCGTGEEAIPLARAGYSVLGIDISPAMVWQAQAKAAGHGLRREVMFKVLPAGRLGTLDERGPFQGAYASLGTLNTEPNLPGFASGLHDLLAPGAPFVATVMGRHCLFEILRNLRRFKPGETLKRSPDWTESRAGTGGVTAPVKFYMPDEFAAVFEPHFTVASVWAFPLWLPPVHLYELYRAKQAYFKRMEGRERRTRSWPGFRAWGDHFLMVLRHAGTAAGG
ncbi:MAG TPA: methyltransferase domain-containing protein [Aggregatilineaceae bacterium]|jgi:SAM-dependent methyltransferase|nr:methyltransferase domain-containing protein [Aggregatilineaceae bacterium]